MILSAFSFGVPLALAGLVALPVIWWLLRATPPRPQEAELPSLRLLEGLESPEETPQKTPWWIILLRMVAAACAILGLAQPAYTPTGAVSEAQGPVLIVIDDGWTSADRWNQVQRTALTTIEGLDRDQGLYLAFTTAKPLHPPIEQRLNLQEAERLLRSVEPMPWLPDRADALSRIQESGISPSQIRWISDGEDHGSASVFINGLNDLGQVFVQLVSPHGAIAITDVRSSSRGANISLARHSDTVAGTAYVTAETSTGTPVASAEAVFEIGSRTATAEFVAPAAVLNRAARFRISGHDSAGAVWLWDAGEKRQTVGLVSANASDQPLLSDVYYVGKALEPFTTLIEGDLTELIAAKPDAIILTDVGKLPDELLEPLEEWINEGGALIRFAGPRLAAQVDTLTPTPLRRASRSLGGALAWDTPQPVAPFPDSSPFAGIPTPQDTTIARQVLAQPSADLASKTWARLEDGTPLVTAAGSGEGMLVLFHVTAGPEWSELPYTGAYVDMLRRAVASGRGERQQVTGDGSLVPLRRLNAFGRLTAPDADDAPILVAELGDQVPEPRHPPGLYEGSGMTVSLNAGAKFESTAITNWPASVIVQQQSEAVRRPLTGPLLTAAAALLLIDIFVALATSGLLRRRRKYIASALVFGLALGF